MGSDTSEEAGRGVELVDLDMQVAGRGVQGRMRAHKTPTGDLDVECGGTNATKTKPNFGRRRRRTEMGFVTDKSL